MSTTPKCPACGHLLRDDGTDGWICSARGGCGSEWGMDLITPEPRYVAREHDRHPGYWGVYDTESASWPSLLGGRRIPHMTQDKTEVERVALALNRDQS